MKRDFKTAPLRRALQHALLIFQFQRAIDFGNELSHPPCTSRYCSYRITIDWDVETYLKGARVIDFGRKYVF